MSYRAKLTTDKLHAREKHRKQSRRVGKQTNTVESRTRKRKFSKFPIFCSFYILSVTSSCVCFTTTCTRSKSNHSNYSRL